MARKVKRAAPIVSRDAILASQHVVDAVAAARRELDMKYGYSRLETSCQDPELRERFHTQCSLWDEAMRSYSLDRIKKMGAARLRGYKALENHAVQIGIKPREGMLQGVMPDGTPFGVVQSHDQHYSEDGIVVWDMKAIGEVLGKYLDEKARDLMQATTDAFPGAVVREVRDRDLEDDIGL